MGNIGEDMTNGTIPPVGTAGTAYATSVNLFLTEVKERLEAFVPLSSILPGELDQLNNPILNVQYLGLADQTSSPTVPVGTLQSFGDELFWVSVDGAVQITTAGTLNAAGIGGITGDYGGADPAQLRFVGVDETFYAYDDYGLGNWARFAARSVDVYGSVAGASRVRVTWAGSTSYSLTLPAALPGSAALLQMSTSGVVTASNSAVESVVMATNANVTLSGTGDLKHGAKYIYGPFGHGGIATTGTLSTGAPSDSPTYTMSTSGVSHVPILGLCDGDRITVIKITGDDTGAVAAPTFVINRVGSPGATVKAYSSSRLGAAGGPFEYTLTLSAPETVTTGEVFWVKVTAGTGTGPKFYNHQTTFDRP